MADDLANVPGPLTPLDPASVRVSLGGPIFTPIVAAAYGSLGNVDGAIGGAREDIAGAGATTTIDTTHETLLGSADSDLAGSIAALADADPSDVIGATSSADGAISSSGEQYTVPSPPDQAVPDPGPPPGVRTPPPGSTPNTSI